jgi:hypothetical protein
MFGFKERVVFEVESDNFMYECWLVSEVHQNFLEERMDIVLDFSAYDFFLECDAERAIESINTRISKLT